jgi:uncharacterized protein YdeI (BOF family)
MAAPRPVVALLVSLLSCVAVAAATATGYAVTPVSWPAASELALAEVVTGGVSASDEYFEIYNASAVVQDAAGLEAVYVTATGATVTRKALFTIPTSLAPGAHLLVANAAGVYAPIADVTYTGGLAADGGVLALRRVGGSVVDSIGWGTAANAFVEGGAAPAPPARSSLERRPGGVEGNWVDTNDNRADWLVNAAPLPQSLTSAPTPAQTPRPAATDTVAPTQDATVEQMTPAPTSEPTSAATAEATSGPTAEPAPTATATAEATADPSAGPSAEATAEATATGIPPTATPTGSQLPATPKPSPSAAPTSIANARALGDDTAVTIEGVLTTRLGVLDGGRGGFLQDATGGIAVYLPAVPDPALPAGTVVRVAGTVYDRYGQRTVRVDNAGPAAIGDASLPAPIVISTGAAAEGLEGRLVSVEGTVVLAPDSLSDGTGLWLDDDSSQLRAVATPSAVGDVALVRGMRVLVVGPLGQRISGSSDGYRVTATEPGSVLVLAASASPTSTDGAAATASDGASDGPTAAPSPGGSAADPTLAAGEPPVDLVSIGTARAQATGTVVHVAGAVTMTAGATGAPELFAIEDSSGGIFVRLPASPSGLVVGRSVELVGILAAPYGQLEIRSVEWLSLGSLDLPPDPVEIKLATIREAVEGMLVVTRGTVDSVRIDAGRLTLAVGDGVVEVRVIADPSTGLTRADVARGDAVVVTGIVGQRASSTGTRDGYRLWLRGRSDLFVLPAVEPTGPAAPTPSASPVHHDLYSAIGKRGSLLDVDATVTVAAGLFEIDGPTIVVDDGTAAVAVILPDGAAPPSVGSRVQVIGKTGSWKGGATVLATHVVTQTGLGAVPALRASGPLDASMEWHLARAYGRISRITHAGARWRVELLVDGRSVVVLGEPGASIPSNGLVVGRLAAVTGVVRRSTSDSSAFQLLPRSARDLLLGPMPATAAVAGSTVWPAASGAVSASDGARIVPRVEIGALGGRVGDRVTISGLVTESSGTTAAVTDGTGEITIGGPDAAEAISLLEPGDAVEVSGMVVRAVGGLRLDVEATTMVALSGGGTAAASGVATTEPSASDRISGQAGTARFVGSPEGRWPAPGAMAVSGLLALAAIGGLAGIVVKVRRRGLRAARVGCDAAAATDVADAADGAAAPSAAGLMAPADGEVSAAGPHEGPLARWVRSVRA